MLNQSHGAEMLPCSLSPVRSSPTIVSLTCLPIRDCFRCLINVYVLLYFWLIYSKKLAINAGHRFKLQINHFIFERDASLSSICLIYNTGRNTCFMFEPHITNPRFKKSCYIAERSGSSSVGFSRLSDDNKQYWPGVRFRNFMNT